MRLDFQAVKERVSMAAVLGHYQIELRKNRGTCPICQTKGSFVVNLEKQLFNCFNPKCKNGGNHLDLVAAIEGLGLYEAAQKLDSISPASGAVPASVQEPAKPRRFMETIDDWITGLIPDVSLEIRKAIKAKILESYKNGQKAAPAK